MEEKADHEMEVAEEENEKRDEKKKGKKGQDRVICMFSTGGSRKWEALMIN